jgi:Rieske Fe-S protein
MNTDHTMTRRGALGAGAAVAGAAALAACASGKPNSPLNSSSSSSSSSASAAAGQPLAKMADIAVGGAVSATLSDGSPIIVSRPTATTAVCFSAKCTHMSCTVQPKGSLLQCPCHGSQYNPTTGAVLRGPAPRPLAPVPVHVDGGEVVTGT